MFLRAYAKMIMYDAFLGFISLQNIYAGVVVFFCNKISMYT